VGRASVLRRGPQEKEFGAPAVSVNEDVKHGPPADLRREAKTHKIASYLLPGRTSIGSADIRQVVKPSQDGVSTPKPEHYPCQPTGNQPRSYKAVRVHRYRGAMKALLS
jgi:hypothetical protein